LGRECASALAAGFRRRTQCLANVFDIDVVAGKSDLGENRNCFVVWLFRNPAVYERGRKIDKCEYLA
jgi:hypothetical protein